MENLTPQEPSTGSTSNHVRSQSPTQLPPQMFTTAAQLLDLTDKKLLLVLRDGRKLIGVLRSWDQFANLVLQDTIERIFAQNKYADIARGVFLVRGENVLILGEIDLDKEDDVPEPFEKASPQEVHGLSIQDGRRQKVGEKTRQAKLAKLGFEMEHAGEALL